MKNFLAIYLGTPAAMAKWNELPVQEQKARQAAGVQAWHAWVEHNKANIVAIGSPLGRTKNVSATGVADVRNSMTAYTVVQATSHEAAAKMFENHPHFSIFPGQAVEVMECLPIPGN